jgi:hypothetical protein
MCSMCSIVGWLPHNWNKNPVVSLDTVPGVLLRVSNRTNYFLFSAILPAVHWIPRRGRAVGAHHPECQVDRFPSARVDRFSAGPVGAHHPKHQVDRSKLPGRELACRAGWSSAASAEMNRK